MSVFWPVGLGWNGLFHVFSYLFSCFFRVFLGTLLPTQLGASNFEDLMTLADSQLPLQRFEGLVLERFADCIDGHVERFLAEIFV